MFFEFLLVACNLLLFTLLWQIKYTLINAPNDSQKHCPPPTITKMELLSDLFILYIQLPEDESPSEKSLNLCPMSPVLLFDLKSFLNCKS